MKIKKWIENNTENLNGKLAAVTGATGGLGRELCRYLAGLGASLILLDRNTDKSLALKNELLSEFPDTDIRNIRVDLEDIETVKLACETLKEMPPDILIHNAGAYSIPRRKCATGLDNVFQIDFASPYYITRELLPLLRGRHAHIVAVGSIAHNYSKTDPNDIDFSGRRSASKVYHNAKRYLMFSLFELIKNERDVSLSVAHPGISFTNITSHYPKALFALIKHPMKLIFMKPKKACLSIVKGVFTDCEYSEWIGPRFFGVWGLPRRSALRTCSQKERQRIFETAEQVYLKMKNICSGE